jgi:death on curing protein
MKDEPRFLSRAEVERLHDVSLKLFGGMAGIGDSGLMDSALASAKNSWHYGGDLFDFAASYAFHIAESQAFVDGNKRTAILSAIMFLAENGILCPKADDILYDAMIAIAQRRMDKKGLAGVFRALTEKSKI